MNKLYLAASWSRQTEMREKAKDLERIGYEVVSHWIHHQGSPWPDRSESACNAYQQEAERDLIELDSADTMIFFPSAAGEYSTGGKNFEMGYAYALGKQIYVIGPWEHIFSLLLEVKHLPDWNTFLCLATSAIVRGQWKLFEITNYDRVEHANGVNL